MAHPRLYWLCFAGAIAVLVLTIASRAQTINNSGFCNIFTQGNNNSGIYVQYCDPSGAAKEALLDPPFLWMGMDRTAFEKMVGARRPVYFDQDGETIARAVGALFGMPGIANYGFDKNGHLVWMSVENQCTETRYDYKFHQPKDLHPSWLEWSDSPDVRTSYEETTECSRIIGVVDTIKKLLGAPLRHLAQDERGRLPSKQSICAGVNESLPCADEGVLRYTFIDEFIGRDRLTNIQVENRELDMDAVVKRGDYYPTARRREIVGVVSVWISGGHPNSSPSVYGYYHPYLERDLP